RLRVRRLIPRRVGHEHGRAVEDLDRPALEEPRGLGLVADGAPGAADQLPEDALGQPEPGVAVAGGLRGDRGEPLVGAQKTGSKKGGAERGRGSKKGTGAKRRRSGMA